MSSDATPDRLARLQKQFAGHIRDPDREAPPAGLDNRRLQIYRELFFNNISGLLASNFPVIRNLYGDADWKRLVREFYAEHRAQTPLFPELPKEFLRYLQDVRGDREDDPPFLLELAHYEWVELALAVDVRELADFPVDRDGDLIEGAPVLSPLAWALSYRFPVHRIGPEFRPEAPGETVTQLLAYRNRADEVRFMQLNDVTQLLLHELSEHPDRSGREHLTHVAARIGRKDVAALLGHGRRLLENLRTRDIVLGTRLPGDPP